ncbi:MAG: hydroxyacid dehydrogenase [Lachnospiraceae bacterium]|uniref:Hydroxyacid dehydrogenase n=1 Tax=Candidatus Weimeria bifida TaxID=2599074 RepID=A0A6N7IZL1_9FIRM|nr:hydroxyacid dehydrogenase [Candidatus Weimeria bifida]RRF96552.1 MAG: hydroxyacid dehydrogenase [Lachnospiraceae bacterium]
MNIVFLDRKSLGDDLDFSPFEGLGNVTYYDFTDTSDPKQAAERSADADILIVNKTLVNEQTIGAAKHLKVVCVTATGTNNLDIPYLESRGIHWHNVAGYSTDSVAQHTIAIALYMYEHLPYYDEYTKSGRYADDVLFTHFAKTFHELKSRQWGIAGLGAIGRRTAGIAAELGCKVVYYSTSGIDRPEKYPRLDWDEFLATSDIISIHSPLNKHTEGLFDKSAFALMKKDSLLVNVARGPIVVEQDLADALDSGEIGGAALDTLSIEPMSPDSPFLKMKHKDRILITPHIAWAATESRQRLMDMIYEQVKSEVSKL